jgi:hypothetical protein
MPTGYTADIKDGISFEQFALNCAKAFGACISMRDLPADTPIPERFVASPYHLDQLTQARNLLRFYEGFSPEEATRKANEEFADAELNRNRRLHENKTLLEHYQAMLRQANEWTPPSEDHAELKKFMIQQIEDSMKWDDSSEYLSVPTPQLSAEEWLESKKAKALKDVEYHKKEWAAEVERTEQRNTWLQQLRESLA